LQIHDFPAPTAHSARRFATTTPLQGLFVLNGPLLDRQSELLGERLSREVGQEARKRIGRAYRLLYSRSPSESEIRIGVDFLDRVASSEQPAQAWLQYLHALLGSNELVYID
jgi:hypothetical protein